MAETWSIRINDAVDICRITESDELCHSFRSALELLPALLEYPEAADILKETCSTLDSALIGKIMSETLANDITNLVCFQSD